MRVCKADVDGGRCQKESRVLESVIENDCLSNHLTRGGRFALFLLLFAALPSLITETGRLSSTLPSVTSASARRFLGDLRRLPPVKGQSILSHRNMGDRNKSPTGSVGRNLMYTSFMLKIWINFGSFRDFWFHLGQGREM